MAQWYYVDKNKQRIGPMDASVLVDALRHGQLNTNSMVWQEGMPAWQPLSMHVDALGVPESMRVRKKEKSGNAGMWIVVILVVGFVGIAVLGILAAIAIPAYQDYTVRAKLSGAINEASAVKLLVSEHFQQHKQCPSNSAAESQMPTPESYASNAVQKIDTGALENGNCAIEVKVSDTLAPGLITGSIYFELTDAQTHQWRCYSDSIQNKYLPAICRNNSQ